MFKIDATGLTKYAATIASRATEIATEVEKALDEAAKEASAAGTGKGAYPWTHPEPLRRVVYHTPWYLRFVEWGRSGFETGKRSSDHAHRHVFHFEVGGREVFTSKVGPIQAQGDTMGKVQHAAEEALPAAMAEHLDHLLNG